MRRPCQSRHRIDDEAQLSLTCQERILCELSILNISKQHTPAHNLLFVASHWQSADLKPAEDTVVPKTSVLNVVGLAGFGCTTGLGNSSFKIIRVDNTYELPVLKFLNRLSKEVQQGMVGKFQPHVRRKCAYKAGNCIDQRPQTPCALPQSLFAKSSFRYIADETSKYPLLACSYLSHRHFNWKFASVGMDSSEFNIFPVQVLFASLCLLLIAIFAEPTDKFRHQ